jgi:hypothetical protein
MFARQSCYFFVRPKKSFLEVCVFLGRTIKAPQVRRVESASKTKFVHFIRVVHRDEVEPPITDWLREAYDLLDTPVSKSAAKRPQPKPKSRLAAPKPAARKPKAKAG